ncbi:MAG: molecular chaperone TorD family protein, partial [Oscillospiraceae bacterium]|nr:molecular chaperone TorD family protein [Oscillospiraceae bacterium]
MNRSLCHFLSRLFARELDAKTLASIKAVRFPEEAPWAEAGASWNQAAAALSDADLEALAADYARVFLGAGLAEAAAAFPYESVYTSPKGVIMQDAWSRMREKLRERGLEISIPSADLMEDHISVELEYLSALDGEAEQAEFVRLHLQNWVLRFCGDVETYAETEFYRAAAGLLRVFAETGAEPPAGRPEQAPQSAASQTAPPPGAGKSFSLSSAELEAALQKLRQDYDVYGPALDGQGKLRFRKLDSFGELVNDRQSDFSPKEVYYPISQTLFRFDENRYETVLPKPEKPILIFAHPCDLNAIRRLDNIFLRNGGQADLYYEALRSRVSFALLECPAG